MSIPVKTLKSGFSLPVYGLGTWQMGGRREVDYSNDEEELTAIRAAIDHGITHIDMAELYGAGHAEELVGQIVKEYDRKKLILTTKVSGHNQAYDSLLRSFAASLQRLDTDYIDLYLLHVFPDAGIYVADTMRAMDRLVEEGVVRNIGVCNMTINRFEEAQRHTANKLVCNQLHYSLHMREIEIKGLLQHAIDRDYFITAWAPLEKGLLHKGDILQRLVEKYSKTPYQIALNWVITQPNVITIPKTTSVEHLEENLGALGWELEPEDCEMLKRNFPNQQQLSDRVPLDYEADFPA